MRHLPRRLAPLAVLCTGLGFVAVAVAPVASADTVTQVFDYTGAEQTFTVPSGVTSVHVLLVGGRGGDDPGNFVNPAAAGGSGATVTADLQVTPGHLLYVEVGGNGQDTSSSGAGGFNGGGEGTNGRAGGGGGGSDVRTSARTAGGSLGTRLLVAGGGGGGTAGGAGGSSGHDGAAGGNGTDNTYSICQGDGGSGGGGGNQGAGGPAGTNSGLDPTSTSVDGQGGSLGTGGAGGASDGADPSGGGGGGGLYGGGGGAGGIDCGGGGGGGSSYADPTLAPDATYDTDTSGTPSVTITYVVPQAPQAVTEPASDVGFYSVTLNGVVNPEGASTNYQFEIRNAGGTTWNLIGTPFPVGSDSPQQVAVQKSYSAVFPGTDYEYQLIATNSVGSTDGGVQSFRTLGGPPDATTTPASGIGQTGATFNGVVNPEGTATNYWFEYGLDTTYGSTTAEGDPLGGSPGQYPVAVAATGLLPGTTYHFKLVARNLGGTTTSDYDQVFTTSPPSPAPSVTTKAATNVGQHGATLNGSVNPHGSATTYFFQYGTTTSYGSSTPAVSAGSGNAAKAVHALLAGLPRHTTFHFRLVATSANGTTNGLDKTFRTT